MTKTGKLQRIGIWTGATLASLLLVVIVVVALVDPIAVMNRHLARVEQLAGAVLGRKLTVGTVEGHLFPTLSVVVHGVQLGSDRPHDGPMLSMRRMEVRFQLWRAIASFGSDIEVEAVLIDGVMLRVRRDVDGHIDLLEVMARLPRLDPKVLEGAVLRELRINRGKLELVDELREQQIVLRRIHVETRGPVALGRPLDVSAQAWWERRSPAHLELRVAAIPRDLIFWPPPPASARVVATGVDLAGAIAWLELPPLFTAGRVDVGIDLVSTADAVSAGIDVRGHGMSTVATTGAGAGVERTGQDAEMSVQAAGSVDTRTLRTAIDSFAFAGAGMFIDGAASFTRPSFEGLESLDATVRADELARLGNLIPALRHTEPGALKLAGRGSGRIAATPERVHVDLDLDGARVAVGQAVGKRAGEHLRIVVDGARDSGTGALSSPGRMDMALTAELPLGVKIDGALLVQPAGVDFALFDLRTSAVALSRAVILSPVLRDLFAGNARAGRLTTSLLGEMSLDGNAFELGLVGRGLEIEADRTTLAGDARMAIEIHTDARGLALKLAGDLGALSMLTLDEHGATLFAKPADDAVTLRAALTEVGGPGSLGRALDALDQAGDQGGAVVAGDGLSPRWRRIALGLDGRGMVRAAHAELAGVPFDDATFGVSLRRGRLRVDSSRVGLMSGHASVAGSVVELARRPPVWALKVDVDDVDLATALAPARQLTGAVEGTASFDGRFRGVGLSIESVIASLDGPLTITTRGVHLGALDFLSGISDAMWRIIALVPGVSARDVDKARGRSLAARIADRAWVVRFHGNQLRIDELLVETALGRCAVGGHAGLDGSVELVARLDLGGDALRSLELVTADATLPIEVAIGGTWRDLKVSTVNIDRILDAAGALFERTVLDKLRAAAAKFQADVNANVERARESLAPSPPAPER